MKLSKSRFFATGRHSPIFFCFWKKKTHIHVVLLNDATLFRNNFSAMNLLVRLLMFVVYKIHKQILNPIRMHSFYLVPHLPLLMPKMLQNSLDLYFRPLSFLLRLTWVENMWLPNYLVFYRNKYLHKVRDPRTARSGDRRVRLGPRISNFSGPVTDFQNYVRPAPVRSQIFKLFSPSWSEFWNRDPWTAKLVRIM